MSLVTLYVAVALTGQDRLVVLVQETKATLELFLNSLQLTDWQVLRMRISASTRNKSNLISRYKSDNRLYSN